MKKILLIFCAMLPLAAQAEELRDTTVNYQDRKFVIGADSCETHVTVYDTKGQKLTKTKECVYIDGTEIERVFVGSPFVPERDLQTMHFRPSFPTVWYGFGNLTGKALGHSNGPTGVRRTGSFELGVTPCAVAVPFTKSKTVGVSATAQLVFSRYNFEKSFAMRNSGGLTERLACPDVSKNSMVFGALRVPVMLSVQTTDGLNDFGFGLSVELRTNAKYSFSTASGTPWTPDGLRLKRFGLNLEASMRFGPAVIRGSYGLTPLFKTADGVKAYQQQLQIGIDIPLSIKMLKKK